MSPSATCPRPSSTLRTRGTYASPDLLAKRCGAVGDGGPTPASDNPNAGRASRANTGYTYKERAHGSVGARIKKNARAFRRGRTARLNVRGKTPAAVLV